MAQMNLLKAGFKGTLGSVYGTEKRDKFIMSAIPFSHAPQNAKQKKSFSAFSSAQKLSGAITRNFFAYTGLKVGNRNRMNVVAEYFKKLIFKYEYNPLRITEILGEQDTFVLTTFSFDEQKSNVTISCENQNESVDGKTDKIFIAICDYENVVLKVIVEEMNTQSKTYIKDIDSMTKPYLVMFKSIWDGKKWVMKSAFCNKEMPIILNGILYINRVQEIENVSVQSGTLKFNLAGATFADGVLKLS